MEIRAAFDDNAHFVSRLMQPERQILMSKQRRK